MGFEVPVLEYQQKPSALAQEVPLLKQVGDLEGVLYTLRPVGDLRRSHLVLHLSLLPSGDQNLNPVQSTTIWMIVKDEEEKIFPLWKIE